MAHRAVRHCKNIGDEDAFGASDVSSIVSPIRQNGESSILSDMEWFREFASTFAATGVCRLQLLQMKERKMPHPKKQWVKPEVRELGRNEVAAMPPPVKEKLFRKSGAADRRAA